MNRRLLAIWILVGIGGGCASASRDLPPWVSGNQHPNYSREHYVLGLGMASLTRDKAEDLKRAESLARSNVAKQLHVSVQESLSTEMESRTEHRGRDQSMESLSQRIIQQSSEQVDLTLEGVEIIARYYDEGRRMHYALAVLPIEKTAQNLSERARTGFSIAEKTLNEARQDLRRRDVMEAMRKTIKATEEYETAAMNHRIARALRPGLADSRVDVDPGGSLMSLVEGLRIQCLDGCSQKARIGDPLPKRIRIQVRLADGTPVTNMPLRVRWPPEGDGAGIQVTTDENGRAVVAIDKVERTGEALNRVTITPAWDSVYQRVFGKQSAHWQNRITGPALTTQYTFRTEPDTRVIVKTEVRRSGEHVNDVILMPELLRGLSDAGFLVTEARGDTAIFSKPVDKNRYDVLVRAQASTEYAGQRANVIMYRAHIRLTAYDHVTESSIASVEGEAVGGASDGERAAERSLRQGIHDLAGPFVEQIRTNLR